MSTISSSNVGKIINKWFKKTIFNYKWLDFNDIEVYESALSLFKFDYLRYYPNELSILKDNLLNNIPLQSLLVYRIANIYFNSRDERNALVYSNLGRFLTGIEIYYSAQIGKGLKINHGVGTVIGARCSIGNNALIHQNVTIGDKDGKRPKIHDNVIIYSGAIIIGDIEIGSNSIIGANSVVLKNVPSNSKVAGAPAKLI